MRLSLLLGSSSPSLPALQPGFSAGPNTKPTNAHRCLNRLVTLTLATELPSRVTNGGFTPSAIQTALCLPTKTTRSLLMRRFWRLQGTWHVLCLNPSLRRCVASRTSERSPTHCARPLLLPDIFKLRTAPDPVFRRQSTRQFGGGASSGTGSCERIRFRLLGSAQGRGFGFSGTGVVDPRDCGSASIPIVAISDRVPSMAGLSRSSPTPVLIERRVVGYKSGPPTRLRSGPSAGPAWRSVVARASA